MVHKMPKIRFGEIAVVDRWSYDMSVEIVNVMFKILLDSFDVLECSLKF